MAKIKEVLKVVWAHVLETLKSTAMLLLFYAMMSSICFMVTMNEEWTGPVSEGLNGKRVAWVVAFALFAAVYNGFLSFATGGRGYEMLVSGNMKRLSAQQLGSSYKISTHKEVQEYREWKGFAMGACIGIFTLIFGLLMGANADKINPMVETWGMDVEDGAVVVSKGSAALLLTCMLLSGWSLMPFLLANAAGAAVSYYWSCLFALIPIAVSGVLYIVGAYAKRGQSIRAQEAADRAAEAEAAKPKKINYGGLPGTKPKKRRK